MNFNSMPAHLMLRSRTPSSAAYPLEEASRSVWPKLTRNLIATEPRSSVRVAEKKREYLARPSKA